MKVLTGGVLIDGTGRDPIPNASVVIGDDGRITEAGALARLPLDAEVHDVGGRTIMPGLMDAHVHFMLAGERDFESVFLKQTSEYMAIKATVSARNLLDAGFTTVRDCRCAGPLGPFADGTRLTPASSPARGFSPPAGSLPPRVVTLTCSRRAYRAWTAPPGVDCGRAGRNPAGGAGAGQGRCGPDQVLCDRRGDGPPIGARRAGI